MALYENVVCSKKEAFVYRIPARTSNRGYRAADWKLDEPDWTGRLKIVAKDNQLVLKLLDTNSGELFAQCLLEGYPSPAMEQVLDSSRYFVVRIQDENGRTAFIGLGFSDRSDSFDLLVSIQDHFKRADRDAAASLEQSEAGDEENSTARDDGPKLDLAFKEGQTIKINITTKKSGDNSSNSARSRIRCANNTGARSVSPFLPPPPGSSRASTSPCRSAGVGTDGPTQQSESSCSKKSAVDELLADLNLIPSETD